MTVREILHAHVPVLSKTSTVRDAIDKMDVYQFPALPIVDADRCPIAVVTEGDISRAIQEHGSLHALREEHILRFATTKPTTATPDLEVSDALHLMLSNGISILPIVEDNNLCGIVLRVDLMHAMLLDSTVGA